LSPSAETVAEARRILEENAKGVAWLAGEWLEAVHARQIAFLPPLARWFLS
jgi:citrate lyase beta subunit